MYGRWGLSTWPAARRPCCSPSGDHAAAPHAAAARPRSRQVNCPAHRAGPSTCLWHSSTRPPSSPAPSPPLPSTPSRRPVHNLKVVTCVPKDGSLVPLGHEYDVFATSRATGTGRIGPRRAQHRPQATCGQNKKPSPVLYHVLYSIFLTARVDFFSLGPVRRGARAGRGARRPITTPCATHTFPTDSEYSQISTVKCQVTTSADAHR